MKGIAHITFRQGGLILPASTPYDRQLLFEHVAQYAKQHGRIGLGLDRRQWIVAQVEDTPQACATCNQQIHNVAYTRSGHTLCHPCARADARLFAPPEQRILL